MKISIIYERRSNQNIWKQIKILTIKGTACKVLPEFELSDAGVYSLHDLAASSGGWLTRSEAHLITMSGSGYSGSWYLQVSWWWWSWSPRWGQLGLTWPRVDGQRWFSWPQFLRQFLLVFPDLPKLENNSLSWTCLCRQMQQYLQMPLEKTVEAKQCQPWQWW